MKKRLVTYRKRIDDLLLKGDCDWEELINEHLIQISFFQHERLVHLIVTSLFAILEVVSVVMILMNPAEITVLILSVVLAILLIPYILHYNTLENEVQKLYVQYDKMREACVNAKKKDPYPDNL